MELYALLSEMDEGERVAEAMPVGGSVLELGCGAGRMTRQLVRLGFRVTAVDESAAMLAYVENAETVCARIDGLELGRPFDGVVLASNLINAPADTRKAFLATCRRHSDLVVVEGLPLGWQPRGQGDAAGSGEVEAAGRALKGVDGSRDGRVHQRIASLATQVRDACVRRPR
ncbi:MAG TPA: class I SAM-dependent methyltransferase [Gaiellaceae bacterium]